MEMSTNLRQGHAWQEACVHATQEIVAEAFEVSTRSLTAAGRSRANISMARQTAMYLKHIVCCLPLATIARIYKRDRTTVGYAIRKIEDMRDEAAFDTLVHKIEQKLQRRLEALEFQMLLDQKSTYVVPETKMLPVEEIAAYEDSNVTFVQFGGR